MRPLITMILFLALATVLPAADWVDNLDGNHQVTVTFVVPDQVKDDMEQARADFNQQHYYSGEERDASAWLKELFEGAATTRSEMNLPGQVRALWVRLKRRYVSRQQRQDSVDSGDTEMRAVTIPSPVPAP